ncbi:MAG TPA: ATP-binding protein [Gemmatimonadaceae bacterium]|nr:ATP-binding protein [Gemmatimonadaceae bacterium]
MTSKTSRYIDWGLWFGILILSTVVMRGARPNIQQAQAAFVYILIVLGATVGGERWLGICVAFLGFFAINYFFQPPFDTLDVGEPLDVLALISFLSTALVANYLLAKARAEAKRAQRHAEEVESLSAEVRHAEALREASRLKDILLASVSHDLRTPLTAIRALAQDIAADGSRARGHAEIIVGQADRLGKMVADVLDLSRLKAGAFTMNTEVNTAEDLLGATIRQFSGVPDAKRIETVIDYSQPALLGTFDFVQSLRVMTNLVDNALRCSRDAPVTITVAQSNGSLSFRIADRGPGVPVSERERIFDSFYRPNGAAADAGASGLGLSIARQLAEAQGGSVCYEDRAGGGSVFTFEIPAAKLDTAESDL